jgi:tight adherence protein C
MQQIILVLSFILLAAGMTMLVRAFAWARGTSTPVARRIAAYGFSGDPATPVPGAAIPSPTAVGGLVEWLGRLIATHTRSIRVTALRQDLMRAGMHGVTPNRLLGYQAFSAIGVPVIAVALARFAGYGTTAVVFAALVGIPIGWILPHALVRRRGKIRSREIDLQLPDMIDLLVVTVEAGLSFSASLRIASEHVQGPLGEELRLTLQEQSLGLAANEALENILARVDTPALRSFVQAVLQGETLGVSIGQILRNIADDMRKRRRALAEEKAHKAPIKILFPLVFFIFPAMFVVILVPAVFTFLDAFK